MIIALSFESQLYIELYIIVSNAILYRMSTFMETVVDFQKLSER